MGNTKPLVERRIRQTRGIVIDRGPEDPRILADADRLGPFFVHCSPEELAPFDHMQRVVITTEMVITYLDGIRREASCRYHETRRIEPEPQ